MSTSPASTELDEPASDDEPESGKCTPRVTKHTLLGASCHLRSGTAELEANLMALSETIFFLQKGYPCKLLLPQVVSSCVAARLSLLQFVRSNRLR